LKALPNQVELDASGALFGYRRGNDLPERFGALLGQLQITEYELSYVVEEFGKPHAAARWEEPLLLLLESIRKTLQEVGIKT